MVKQSVPVTYNGEVIGTANKNLDGSYRMEILTENGKNIMTNLMNIPIGVSSRRIAAVDEDWNILDESPPFEFAIVKIK